MKDYNINQAFTQFVQQTRPLNEAQYEEYKTIWFGATVKLLIHIEKEFGVKLKGIDDQCEEFFLNKSGQR